MSCRPAYTRWSGGVVSALGLGVDGGCLSGKMDEYYDSWTVESVHKTLKKQSSIPGEQMLVFKCHISFLSSLSLIDVDLKLILMLFSLFRFDHLH